MGHPGCSGVVVALYLSRVQDTQWQGNGGWGSAAGTNMEQKPNGSRIVQVFPFTFIYSVIGRLCARPRMQDKLVLWCNFKWHFSLSSQKVGCYRYLVYVIWLSCWYEYCRVQTSQKKPIRRTRVRRGADSFGTLSVPALNSQKGWPLWRHKEFDFVRWISCLVY